MYLLKSILYCYRCSKRIVCVLDLGSINLFGMVSCDECVLKERGGEK